MSRPNYADRAPHYHRARPDYAPGVLDFVRNNTTARSPLVVADVGCGTGLATRALLPIAGRLIAVEPDPEMRAVAESELTGQPVNVLDGSAENSSLPDNSVSLIVAASCMEWFQPAQAATEFRRILAPSGLVLLMWNHRCVVDDATRAWDRLWLRHMGPRVAPYPADIENLLVPGFLGPGYLCYREVVLHDFDEARLQELARSSSYAPRLTQQRRWRALREDINRYAAAYGTDNRPPRLAFETVAFLGRPLTRSR